MNAAFQRLMEEAARLTRSGNLKAATSVIQAALGHGPGTHADDDVIDVEAREVPDNLPHDLPEAANTDLRDADIGHVAPSPNPAARFVSGSHVTTSGARDYKLFEPPRDGDVALPLVVMLHGCTQDPDDFAAGTRMNDLALARGFVVLYPAQAQRANTMRCWNWFKHNHQQRDRGEPALLAGMTREVIARYNIDPKRVFVAGLSAGGAMAAILGHTYPDVFAAVGVHSGLPHAAATDFNGAFAAMKSGATPAPSAAADHAAPPTIVFHGDQDTTVHPVNGELVIAAAVGDGKAEIEQGQAGHAYTRRIYRNAAGRTIAEHWNVHGAGHAWSGGSGAGSYTDSGGPDASSEMLRFFLAN